MRLDPLAGGTGGGGSRTPVRTARRWSAHGGSVPVAFNTNTTTNAVNRSYAVPTFEALRVLRRVLQRERRLCRNRERRPDDARLRPRADVPFDSAPSGHVALTAGIPIRRHDRHRARARLRPEPGGGVAVWRTPRRISRSPRRGPYAREWWRYDAGLRRPSGRLGSDAVRQYYRSVNVVKASEDKMFPGAIAAGLASPWGQSVPAGNFANGQPTYFGSYREVFARDLYEAFTGLLVAGDISTAQDATLFLFDRQQQADGSMPRNSLLNGKVAPDTGGLQLDETSYPILMAWQSGLAGERRPLPRPRDPGRRLPRRPRAVRRCRALGGAERLLAVDDRGRDRRSDGGGADRVGQPRRGTRALYQATADQFARKIKDWTVTTSGPYAPRYFMRRVEDRRPQRRDLLRPRQRQHHGRSAVDGRRRGSSSSCASGVLPATDPDVPPRSRSSTR